MSCRSCQESKLRKARQILEGYARIIIKDAATEEVSEQRMAICNPCPNAKLIVRVQGVEVKKCGLCNCPLAAKTRVKDEKCEIGKW